MGDFDIDRYLARIAYDGSREPTRATLTALHLAHLLLRTYRARSADPPGFASESREIRNFRI